MAFSLEFQNIFLIPKAIFSHSRIEQFWKQNPISRQSEVCKKLRKYIHTYFDLHKNDGLNMKKSFVGTYKKLLGDDIGQKAMVGI